MDQKDIYKYCKQLGCCEGCCLRYIGIKNPNAYENLANFVLKYQEQDIDTKPLSTNESDGNSLSNNTNPTDSKENLEVNSKTEVEENIKDTKESIKHGDSIEDSVNTNSYVTNGNGENVRSDSDGETPCKRRKLDVCVSCLGVLQEDNWTESYIMAKEVLNKKKYECDTFACALSAPIATLLREKAITLRLADKFPAYDMKTITLLKEAWKWSFGIKLGTQIQKTLDSGAVSPLLITVNYDYADDLQELEILKQVSPRLFEERSKQKRRFATEFTRKSVEQALENATLESLQAADGGGLAAPAVRALCVGAAAAHAPLYLAGRYIKLSRMLPQSPWVLEGTKVLPSSVQEIIYKPIADLYKWDAEEADRKLKLIAAGREDVDVRCLGEGRPFAIEITDPTRQLSCEELAAACTQICASGDLLVRHMTQIGRQDLILLKKGEETKNKTYEALCVKLSHSKYDNVPADSPITVTPEDISRINTFRNTPGTKQASNPSLDPSLDHDSSQDAMDTSQDAMDTSDVQAAPEPEDPGEVRVTIYQKTPIRVLHRRPLLTRTRHILSLSAEAVPDNPQLFRVFVRTSAGAYVKEWVHGELGRSSPALGDALGAKVDLLALDVTAVHLDWPPNK